MHIFFWFFKQLYYILKRFKLKNFLLLLAFFVIAFFLFIKPSFAFSESDLSYSGMTSQQQTDVYNYIMEHRLQGDMWDSVFVRYYVSSGVGRYTFIFYNINSLGRLYEQAYTDSPKYYNYNIYAEDPTQYNNYYHVVTSADFTEISSGYGTSWPLGIRTGGTDSNVNHPSNAISDQVFATNRNIYTNNNFNNVWFQATEHTLADVQITNNPSTIIDFSFTNLSIDTGGLPYDDYYELRYYYPDNNTYYTANINSYKTLYNNRLIFEIPKSFITDNIVIRSGSTITFNLFQFHRESNAVTQKSYYLGTYTLSLTTEQQTQINEDSDKQLMSDIKQEQQQTTQAIESLENTITDTNIDNSSITLPTDTTTDITRDGLNNIFTMLYNAFCTGTPQDIVLPIPYTNKSITINPNYLHDMLYNYTGTWLINIIEAFYWYIISRFIIKDIVNKINKIKSGDLEKIETSNIKGDML